jgi:hypothetical protein
MEQHREVGEVTERRGPWNPLERVESDGEPLGLQGGLQYEWYTALEHRWCDGETAQELMSSIPRQQFVRGRATYAGPFLSYELLIV